MEEICIASENTSEVNGDVPTIASFLAGKNIFITGGTGFLGTVLIERLLSATDEIGNIYVLIRAKNGFSPDTRIKRMMSKTVSIDGGIDEIFKFLAVLLLSVSYREINGTKPMLRDDPKFGERKPVTATSTREIVSC